MYYVSIFLGTWMTFCWYLHDDIFNLVFLFFKINGIGSILYVFCTLPPPIILLGINAFFSIEIFSLELILDNINFCKPIYLTRLHSSCRIYLSALVCPHIDTYSPYVLFRHMMSWLSTIFVLVYSTCGMYYSYDFVRTQGIYI